MNATDRNALITKAIADAVSTGKAGWKKDIIPAVSAAVTVSENGWMEVRNCLGGMLKAKQICRAAFDPEADDEYYVLPGTPGAR